MFPFFIPDLSEMVQIAKREADYARRNADLDARQLELAKREIELHKREIGIVTRELENPPPVCEIAAPVHFARHPGEAPPTPHPLSGKLVAHEIPAPDYSGEPVKMPDFYKPENWSYGPLPSGVEEIKFARPQHRHHNQLTPAEAEKLALIVGACAQVSGQVSEVLRHDWRGDNGNARGRLEVMLGDLMGILRIAESAGIVRGDRVNLMIPHAIQEFSASLHHK